MLRWGRFGSAGVIGAVTFAVAWSAAAVSAQTGNAAIRQGELKTFTDWTVACDNVLRCEATNLDIRDEELDDRLDLTLSREPGGANVAMLTVAVDRGWPAKHGAIGNARIVVRDVQGRATPVTMTFQPKEQKWRSVLTPALVNRLRDADHLAVLNARSEGVAIASLNGFTATMRYIDDKQARAGGVTALVARGARPASEVPAARLLPVVRRAVSSTAARPYQPSAAEWAKLVADNDCDTGESWTRKNEAVRLDAATTLIAVPCGHGAYNFSTVYYVAKNGGNGRARITPVPMDYVAKTGGNGRARITPVPMDYEAAWGEEAPGTPLTLVNSDYNPKTRTISHYAKGRGLGDCGDVAQWVWDGNQFRLVERSMMGDCRGSTHYLTVWRAAVR